MILRPHLPRAVLGERMARAGDDAPAGGGKALHRRMADAAARPGEEQRAARLVRVRARHDGRGSPVASSRVEPRLGPGAVRRLTAKLDAVVQAVRTVLP